MTGGYGSRALNGDSRRKPAAALQGPYVASYDVIDGVRIQSRFEKRIHVVHSTLACFSSSVLDAPRLSFPYTA
jgi:hypothetical protein